MNKKAKLILEALGAGLFGALVMFLLILSGFFFHLGVKFRHITLEPHKMSGFIKKAVLGFGSTDKLSGLCICHLISYGDHDSVKRADGDTDFYIIAEGAGMLVFTSDGSDRRIYIVSFHFRIRKTELVHIIHLGFFHPADIIGVVGYPHHICFIILYRVSVCSHLLRFRPLALFFEFYHTPADKKRTPIASELCFIIILLYLFRFLVVSKL